MPLKQERRLPESVALVLIKDAALCGENHHWSYGTDQPILRIPTLTGTSTILLL
ncbi:rCG32529 [Rattus norvegicus]|uniref:RCG32529 n=1 Tax=Rattus norvegicus TaxID=10116 RepID=A6HHX5_RAT|nr:rCG32529 [Rattus norvegicus]